MSSISHFMSLKKTNQACKFYGGERRKREGGREIRKNADNMATFNQTKTALNCQKRSVTTDLAHAR